MGSELRDLRKSFTSLLVICMVFSLFSSYVFANGDGQNKNHKPKGPLDLTVNYLTNPTGVEKPTFGWMINDQDDNELQTHYQIIVASSEKIIQHDNGDVWDSGKVNSSFLNAIHYEGKKLESNKRYYWKVRTWDREGEVSKYSKAAYFDTGLLFNEDWSEAKWIKRTTDDREDYTYARKNINLPNKNIKRAMAYISATHKYTLYINQSLVGKGPAFAEPAYQYYNSFEVTDLLKKNKENNVSVLYHWFGGGQGRPASARGLIMKLIVEYDDGTLSEIGTDGTWKIKKAEQWKYVGQRNAGEGVGYIEKIDARDIIQDWNSISFDDRSWANATVIGDHPTAPWTGRLLTDQTKIVESEIKPIAVNDMGNGKYVFDFGKVYAGVPQVTFSGGEPGTTVNMRSGYTLNEDGTVSTVTTQKTNMSYYYILDGNTTTFEPFQYLGFRYLQIDNSPNELTLDNVKLIRRHSELDGNRSSFESSNEMLNKVWELMTDSIYLGAQEGFVDTPTREKGQFLGDAASLPVMQVFGERVLSKRALDEFTQSQWEDGRLWAVYPTNDKPRDIPDYTLMYINWVWDYYTQTGDIHFLKENYDKFKKILDYLNTYKDPKTGLIYWLKGGSGAYQYGIIDWPATMRYGYDMNTDSRTVINGYAYLNYEVMSKIAGEIGETEDKALFDSMAKDMAGSINTWLMNSQKVYVDGLYQNLNQSLHVSQQANIFPAALNIVPSEDKLSVLREIKNQKMNVGMLNIKWLIQSIGEAGLGQHLLDLYTNKEWNGWANIISKGATSTWESWDADIINESLSHPWGTAGLYGIQEYILGVKQLLPQHEKIMVKPLFFGEKLQYAKGKLPTDRGDVFVGWNLNDKSNEISEYTLTLTIPDNIKAKVYVPKGNSKDNDIYVDGKKVHAAVEGEYLYVDNIGSGQHTFVREADFTKTSSLAGVNLDTPKLDLPEGEERQLTAIAYDTSLNDLAIPITWETDDARFVEVTQDGKVKGISAGVASITATAIQNGITKKASVTVQVVSPQNEYHYDFGNGKTASGYEQVTSTTLYDQAKGFGLIGTNLDQRDRGTSDPLRSDFVFSKNPYSFARTVSNGIYEVRVIIGDAIAAQGGRMTIKADGQIMLQNITTSNAGEYREEIFTVTVSDGKLDLEFSAEGSDTTARINALDIVRKH